MESAGGRTGFSLRCMVEMACNEKAASGHLADSCRGKLEQTRHQL